MAAKKSSIGLIAGSGIAVFVAYELLFSPTAEAAKGQVNPGAVLNYSAQISTGFTQSVPDILQQVSAILDGEGISVTNTANNSNLLARIEAGITLSGQSTDITLQVQVNNSGYAKASDLQSVIDNAIFQASGSMPQSSSIAFSSSGVQVQGASSPNPQTGGLTDFFTNFGGGAATGILLSLAGIVAIVVMFPEVVGVAAASRRAA